MKKCNDCGRDFNKGEEVVDFDGNGYKCKECYEANPILENFRKCDVYSRVVGFHTVIDRWNPGKKEEWKDRLTFNVA